MNNKFDNNLNLEAKSLLQTYNTDSINPWLIQLLYVQLYQCGVFSSATHSLDFSSITSVTGIDSQFQGWWEESIHQLLVAGLVSQQTGQFIYNEKLLDNTDSLWQAWDNYRASYSEDNVRTTQMNLVDVCLRNLPKILTGKVQATEIIFPNSSMDKIESIYKNNPVSDYFNKVVTNTISSYVEKQLTGNANAQLRLVEIGAGTGGTTAMVLPSLLKYQRNIQEYLYTDISQAFLIHARQNYGHVCPFLEYDLWDIEQPLATQPINQGSYDIAIATNVLHATKDIRVTLRNAKSALCQGGMLIINELSDKSIFTHLTFGLLKGWWLYEDPDLRIAGSPAIKPNNWKDILEEEGYFAVKFPVKSAHVLGQAIIVSKSDGVIRQKVKNKDCTAELVTQSGGLSKHDAAISKNKSRINVAEHVTETIIKALAKSINITAETIDSNIVFSEYGIDSILSVNLVNQISEQLKISLNPAVLYDYVTVAKLSEHIVKIFSEKIIIELPVGSTGSENQSLQPAQSTFVEQAKSAAEQHKNEKYFAHITASIINALMKTINISSAQIDEMNETVAFSDVGIDSILSVNFLSKISQSLGITLNPALLYEYTTVKDLSKYIATFYADQILAAPPVFVTAESKKLSQQNVSQLVLPTVPQQKQPLQSLTNQVRQETAIAVIGISGQFPGANDVNTFWDNLLAGKNSIQELPDHYLDQAKYFDASGTKSGQPNKTYCKWGGIVSEKDCFDPQFFNISEQDALTMSIHQRIVLQEGWKALEDAGYNPKELADTGVSIFIGAEPVGYNHGSFIGSSEAIVASRLSYFLNLKGPAIAVNTGCSSSAVAIHLACESLRNLETDFALSGGVFASLDVGAMVSLSSVGMLSHDPKCSIFDESTDGMLLSEGAGMVVLKRLQDAQSAGDPIYGIILGSGINQDGASNGILAPSGTAQQQLLTQIYQKYQINPADISYLEAHATGGKLSNSIEINALARTFKKFTIKQHYCALGSVKSHIGHTSAASGVVGLIKILLSMRHGRLPGLLHYRQADPLLELQDSAFYIQNETVQWQTLNTKPLLAALNSFGHSGTNAHFVIKQYVSQLDPKQPPAVQLLIPLSAKTLENLQAQAKELYSYLEVISQQYTLMASFSMQSLAYTLQVGREAMKHRLVLISQNLNEFLQQLLAYIRGEVVANTWYGHAKSINKKQTEITGRSYQNRKFFLLSSTELIDIGKNWLQGQVIVWQSFYDTIPPKRINLPAYAFSKKVFRPALKTLSTLPLSQVTTRSIDTPTLEDGIYSIGHSGVLNSDNPWSVAFNSNHNMLKNHRAFGQQLLPGLAYIDLLFQFFRNQGFDYRQLEMRNLSIHHAFTINSNYEVKVQISCQKNTGKSWNLQVEGYEIFDAHTKSKLKLYITAEMHQIITEKFNETINFDLVRASSTNSVLLKDAYAAFGGDDIQHTGPMLGTGIIHRLSSANFIEISVPNNSLFKDKQYMFHPVLIDGSAIGSGDLFLDHNQNIFLPIYYESFRATELMFGQCITRIKRSSLKQTKQLSYLTMDFFKCSGEKIAELKNFTCKLVRDPAAINSKLTSASEKQTQLTEFKRAKVLMKNETTVNSKLIEESSTFDSVVFFLKKTLAKTIMTSPEDIQTDIGFYELGLDSTGLLQIVKSFEKSLKIKLNPIVLFEYATVGELAEYLLEQHPEKFSSMTSRAVTQLAVAPVSQTVVKDMEKISTSDAITKKNKELSSSASADVSPVTSLQLEDLNKDLNIAVIGMSGRYPGAYDIQEFWENLKAGKDSVTQVPENRWQHNIIFHDITSPSGRPIPQWGGFIDDVDCFDQQFFRISPREAQWLDPQERMFLETCWSTIEDSGYTPETLMHSQGINKRRDVGVFVGVMHKDYALIAAEVVKTGNVIPLSMNYAPIANRVSYFCGFHGPSFAVDTVCSASLTALHLALESIRHGESKIALAGGVNLSLHPYKYLTYGLADMYSSDGRCRTFGKGGNGFISSEGVGAVLLKPLSQAVRDVDNIYAVIKGSTINHVGHVSGITVPSQIAQADLMLRCYEKTGIDPRTISYIEAHGTGTSLGDPIEMQGLVKAFRQHTKDEQFCAIGSVKSNIGHAESAAGISGLSKVLLQLHHKTLVPSLHSKNVNPYLDLAHSPFYVQQETQDWEQPRITDGDKVRIFPRRAGISSFGATGSNAHIILEEYIPNGTLESADCKQNTSAVVPLSAKNDGRLKVIAQQLEKFLIDHQKITNININDLAFTLQIGRCTLEERVVFLVNDPQELQKKLAAFTTDNNLPERCWRGSSKENERDTSFMSEEDSIELLTRWVAQKALHKIARFWIEGFNVDWHKLYTTNNKPRRMRLPTYPFARERYWLAVPKDLGRIANLDLAIQTNNLKTRMEAEEVEKILFFSETWQQAASNQEKILTNGKNLEEKINTIICFLSNSENQALLEASIQSVASEILIIFISQIPASVATHPNRLHLVRGDVASYRQSFEQIKSMQIQPQQSAILYLWPLEDNSCIRDFSCVQHLLIALAKTKMIPARVLFSGISNNGLERCYLESWIGIERSLISILPKTQIAIIFKVESQASIAASVKPLTELWTLTLYQELISQRFESVCYEDNIRHVLKIQPECVSENLGTVIKQGGTYLITGGFGCLGVIFSRYLAQHYSANLVLTGRSAIDVRKQDIIDDLIKLGGQVHYIQANVSDVSSMRFGLAQARQSMGTIVGVIHAAGLEASATVFEKSWQEFNAIINPKIEGTQILDELLAQDPLDFVCYFSSSAAILGDFGSCDYAIGNRFQMAYGKHRSVLAQKGKTLVINWPFWKEGGMGIQNKDSTEFYLKSSGQRALESKEGLQIFEQLLEQTKCQYLVIAGQPSRVAQFLRLDTHQKIFSHSVNNDVVVNTQLNNEAAPICSMQTRNIVDGTNTVIKDVSESKQNMSAANIKRWVIADLKAQISNLLKTVEDRLGLKSNFIDFGFNSISLAEFAQNLTNYFHIEITPALFFSHSSIMHLAQYLCHQYQDKLQIFYQKNKKKEIVAKNIGSALNKMETIAISKNALPTVPKIQEIPTAATTSSKNQDQDIMLNSKSTVPLDESIAVIGMSGRFPQADNIDEYWDHLITGKSCIGDMTDQRWDWQALRNNQETDVSDSQGKNTTIPKWGAFMKDIMRFDATFFDITPKEAIDMDPRQRIFLQEAWSTFEDAGYMGKRIQDMSCGVYAGVEESDYGSIVGEHDRSINGNQNATLAARIAYALDLKGPNMALTAACASGLVAVHQACLSLRQGDCEMALAGGINLLMTPWVYLSMHRIGMLSPNGTARVFDQRANGLVPGEAVAIVLLKPLSKAESDGDLIYGCIKASGVNYDGKTNGITAPNPVRQAELLKHVYDRYQITPRNIQYVMSHSTGSKLGDPIEVQALQDAFANYTTDRHFCALGSIKPLIGHTFAASGVVSLISMLKAMQHQVIPATRQYEVGNSYIKLEHSPFIIHSQNQSWPRLVNKPRLGTISASGISGTNAHAVIEEYIAVNTDNRAESMTESSAVIMPISAKTTSSLYAYIQSYKQLLQQQPHINLMQLAYNVQTGRDAMDKRVVFVVHTIAELQEKLQDFITGNESFGVFSGEKQVIDDMDVLNMESHSELSVLMQRWIANHELHSLAKAWAEGAEINWFDLYQNGLHPKRMSIPVYPFQGKIYWANTVMVQQKAAASQPCKPPVLGSAFALSNEAQEKDTENLKTITQTVRTCLLQSMYFEEDEVKNDHIFTELGMNSVNAIAFIEKLNKIFCLELTTKTIFEHPSLDTLSLHIDQTKKNQAKALLAEKQALDNPLISEPTVTNHNYPVENYAVENKALTKHWLKHYPECIPLNEQGSKPPCFWIHPLTGSVALYLKIAKKLEQPMLAIQSCGFLTKKKPLSSIESMARYYIKILQANDPKGPYQLAGYSMGGVIAYEMARQLQLERHSITNLILLEPPFPDSCNYQDQSSFRYQDALLMSANFFLHYGLKAELSTGKLAFENIAFFEQDLQNYAETDLLTGLASACLQKGIEQPLVVIKEKIENMAQILKLNREAIATYKVQALPNIIDVHYMTILASSDAPSADKLSILAENNRNVLGKNLIHDESHCQKWLQYFSHAQVFRTHAKDHFHLLSESKSIQMISDKCLEIYNNVSTGKHTNHANNYATLSVKNMHGGIAVIGMSGQFPNAKNLNDFWTMLKNRQSAFTELPAVHRGWSLVGDNTKKYASYGGFLTDIEYFDPLFFQIAPNEAAMLDPCERLFLQETWKAIEDAGIDPTLLSGKRWGVLCGSSGDYALRFKQHEHVAPNITLSQVPGRVSYSLNLKGPCHAVEAGCASSLLAVAQACDYLVLDKCEAAIAGGALIYSTPNMLISSSKFGLLSNAKHGCAFDANANGMMPGESIGVLVLKTVQQALIDNDRIHGVIEAWGNNHNGKTNGMMSPSGSAQEALLSEIYQKFNIDSASISLIEAHAAGMPMADVIEIKALSKAFQKNYSEQNKSMNNQFCALGSVENNIGHAFHNSGMNHILKVLLAIKNKEIPATNIHNLEPTLQLKNSPFYINSDTIPWVVQCGQVRRATVSSLGATGINVHLVITSPPETTDERILSRRQPICGVSVLITLSGKTDKALIQRCQDLLKFLEIHPEVDLKQLSANLLLRRSHFSCRCSLVTSSSSELKSLLNNVIDGTELKKGYRSTTSVTKCIDSTLSPNKMLQIVTNIKQIIDSPNIDNLLALAELYVDGVNFFATHFSNETQIAYAFTKSEKFPLSLPGYPFDKRSCWADVIKTNSVNYNDFTTKNDVSAQSRIDEKNIRAIQKQDQVKEQKILQQLIHFLSELTGLSDAEIDVAEHIASYGIDSLQGLRLLNRINTAFAAKFDAHLLAQESIQVIARKISQSVEVNKVSQKDSAIIAIEVDEKPVIRPVFIDYVALNIKNSQQSIAANDIVLARTEFGQLLHNGIGVWKEQATLCFEFYQNTHNADYILQKVQNPYALWTILDVGKRYYPTSHIQKLILHETEVKKRPTFNIGQGFWLDMPVNLSLLNQAVNDTVKQHSILRTGTEYIAGEWTQIVHNNLKLVLQEVCWSYTTTKQEFKQKFTSFQKEVNVGLFETKRTPMFDVYFVHNNVDLGAVYFVTHHFHADGFTLFLFQQELYDRYISLLNGCHYISTKQLAEYAHFALYQFGEYQDTATQYWLNKLYDKRSKVTLQDKKLTFSGGHLPKTNALNIDISVDMLDKLQSKNRYNNTTLTQLVTCALAALVYRITTQNMPIQMVYNLRDKYEFETVYGDFSSSVPIILDIQPHFNLKNVLQCYEQELLQVQKHKHLDFLALHASLSHECQDMQDNTLLGSIALDSNDRDTFVDVTNFAERLIPMPLEDREPVAPLLVCLIKTHGSLSLSLVYNRNFFSPDLIQILADNLLDLLHSMVDQPDLKLDKIAIEEELVQRLSPELATAATFNF